MKLKLNEKTLNAYINAALNEELDELFGSRVRKQSQRMITGKGWGNQKRTTTNGWGAAANSAIDINADAESDTPQTLVGMIMKMEQGLQAVEQMAGIASPAGNLAASVTGASGVKGSLLAAINALTQLGNRLNAVERKSGSNAIMENTRDAAGYSADAAVGGNAVAGNARNINQLSGLQKTAKKASSAQAVAGRKVAKPVRTAIQKGADSGLLDVNGAAYARAVDANKVAKGNMEASHIGRNTGFWGKQLANIQNGADGMKSGFNTIKGAKNAANVTNATTKMGKAMKTAGNVVSGVGKVAKGFGQVSQLALTILSIADEAARQAAQGRQRNIVRTYNAAAIIARRLGNIMQEIEDAQQGGATYDALEESVNEINVHRGMKSFDSIKTGMTELSKLMRQIGGATQGNTQNRVIEIPQGLDLNTRQGVLAFQQWVNSITDADGNALITDKNGNTLKEDGIFGNNTNFVYDKIAQMIQSQGRVDEGIIKESKAVETALANLERVAGATGSGGNAYSDIDSMSGGANASRLQNAQNIKNIIRTYPPVLNQYLNILADTGANVSGLQPLNVDTRPHRNYSVKELQAIDARIQELLQIARTVETPDKQEQQNGNIIIKGTLPPKPVRQPRPQPNPAPVPAPKLPELEIPEIEDETFDIDTTDLFKELDASIPNVELIVNPYTLESYGIIPNDKTGRITKRELKQKIKDAVGRGVLTQESAKELIKQLRQDYRNGVAQQYTNPDGSVAYTTHKAQQAAKRRGETNRNTPIQQPAAVPMNEQTFKKLIKQIIREELKR